MGLERAALQKCTVSFMICWGLYGNSILSNPGLSFNQYFEVTLILSDAQTDSSLCSL